MKHLITLVLLLLTNFLATAQDINIETKSVSIDNFITFIVDNFENRTEADESDIQHYIFLIQTSKVGLIAEDKVILKQAFKLLSKRLSILDSISIIAYSGVNGIALHKTSSENQKAIMYTVEHLSTSVKELHHDGIGLAYKYANDQSDTEIQNTVVMVRNPKALSSHSQMTLASPEGVTSQQPKQNNAVLLTAISLLPQIISVIKD